jgi:Protein of unknown function (DUF3592)
MPLYLAAGGIGLFALALLVSAVVEARKVLAFRQGSRARATVRELKKQVIRMRSDDGQTDSDDVFYAPLFEFKAPDGAVHRVEGDASSPASYRVGDEAWVLFDPADPRTAKVETFAGLWLGVVLKGLAGGVTFVVALFFLWFASH